MQIKINFQNAKEILESQNIAPLGIERVFLHDALGRTLAHSITATADMPTTALSNMDGYAFNSNFQNSKTFKILYKEKFDK